MPGKVQDYINQKIKESQSVLGTAAFKNVPQAGQIALEGEITTGSDVRVQESMQKSIYDPEKDGTINAATLEGKDVSEILSDAADAMLWKYKYKDSNQVRTSTTTLANDSMLTVTLETGNYYRVRFYVLLETANATMDYKFALNFTGTSSLFYTKVKYIAAGGSSETIQAQNTIIGSTSVTAATSGIAYVELDCLVNVTATGTLSFQWAQDTSDAGDLTVLQGSYLSYAVMNAPL